MMHIKINYGRAVATVPMLDPATLARATADDLRILICLCHAGIALAGESNDALCTAIAVAAGCSPMTAAASVAFWRGTGVLELSEEGSTPREAVSSVPPAPTAPTLSAPLTPIAEETPADKPRVTIMRAKNQLPNYSTADLANILEAHPDIGENIHECERLWGNLLNLQETNVLLELSDYLGLEWDYILSLVARCVEETKQLGMKHSMRYVEKQAIRFYDEGITTLDALQEKFRALDELHSTEGKLRRLFGMGERKLTPTETKYFSTWLHDFRYDFEIIEHAYNIAVDTKGAADKRYINGILANWNGQNLRTMAEIEAADNAHRAAEEQKRAATPKSAPRKSAPPPAGGGSFDTDNFFDAAVRRSLGELPGDTQS